MRFTFFEQSTWQNIFIATMVVFLGCSNIQADSKVAISGIVTAISKTGFELSNGKENPIKVDLSNIEGITDKQHTRVGHHVTVYGQFSDALLAANSVNISGMYDHSTNVHYQVYNANTDVPYWSFFNTPNLEAVPDEASISLEGVVRRVDDDELVLDTGLQQITVDTSTIPNRPYQTEDLNRVSRGDYIFVAGVMDKGFFDNNEIDAQELVFLRNFYRKVDS